MCIRDSISNQSLLLLLLFLLFVIHLLLNEIHGCHDLLGIFFLFLGLFHGVNLLIKFCLCVKILRSLFNNTTSTILMIINNSDIKLLLISIRLILQCINYLLNVLLWTSSDRNIFRVFLFLIRLSMRLWMWLESLIKRFLKLLVLFFFLISDDDLNFCSVLFTNNFFESWLNRSNDTLNLWLHISLWFTFLDNWGGFCKFLLDRFSDFFCG